MSSHCGTRGRGSSEDSVYVYAACRACCTPESTGHDARHLSADAAVVQRAACGLVSPVGQPTRSQQRRAGGVPTPGLDEHAVVLVEVCRPPVMGPVCPLSPEMIGLEGAADALGVGQPNMPRTGARAESATGPPGRRP